MSEADGYIKLGKHIFIKLREKNILKDFIKILQIWFCV